MFARRISVLPLTARTLCCCLLLFPVAATAQRHGGGGSNPAGSGSLHGIGQPTGVDEKDSLKDFHHAMAVQATSQQVAEFQRLVKGTEAAQAELQALREQLRKENVGPDSARWNAFDHALQDARTASKQFQDGFSAAQKSGLKEFAKRFAKADSALEQEAKRLDQTLHQSPDLKAEVPDVSASAETLDKVLTEFYNQQLALAREMSITLATGQDLAFILPQVKSQVSIARRTIPVTVSGVLAQIAAQGDQRTFKLELTADLSDLQQSITEILRAQLDTSQTCGQRLAIRQAMLTPATPDSLLIVNLHFERWICGRSLGQQVSNELAEGDGTVEIKLTAVVEKNTLKLLAAFGRIHATGMLQESLRSGSLGEDLLDQAAQSVLSAARAGSDFKTLPPAIQNSVVIESAKFREAGVGGLSAVLDGQIEISNQQADQLASQMNQTLSAQGPPAQ
jgi:hypothetical protein